MARSLLLALAFLCRPAAALRAWRGPRHFICSFGPQLDCTPVDARQPKTREQAEGTFMEVMVVDDDELVIQRWSGRMGNQVRTLAWALVAAESLGLRAVSWEEAAYVLRYGFAELPRRIVVDGKGEKGAHACQTTRSGMTTWERIRCDGVKKSEIRRVLQRYVWPHLTDEARAKCTLEDGFDGLTVHLRSGDCMWGTNHMTARFAPCAYHSKIIESFGYKDVLIVTEPDRQHPCLAELPKRHPSVNFTVQSNSVVEDFCTLARARNLVRSGPFSSFSSFAELFSRNLQKLYLPEECECGGPGKSGSAVETCYHIPGLLQKRNDTEKMDYLISTPESSIEQFAVCALDDMPLDGVYQQR